MALGVGATTRIFRSDERDSFPWFAREIRETSLLQGWDNMSQTKPPILGIIPVRGGSKRLPGKNIRPLAGRPLLAYSILTARASHYISRIVVTSDDPEILATATAWGAEAIRRPNSLSTDQASTISAMQHALGVVRSNGFHPEHIALLQATCPLRRVADVDRAIEEYLQSGADSALTVNELHLKAGKCRAPHWFEPQYPPGIRKQDIEPLYQENGVFYMMRADQVAEGKLFGPQTMMLHFPPEAGIASIDVEFDFQVTEALYHQLGYESEFKNLTPRIAGQAA